MGITLLTIINVGNNIRAVCSLLYMYILASLAGCDKVIKEQPTFSIENGHKFMQILNVKHNFHKICIFFAMTEELSFD